MMDNVGRRRGNNNGVVTGSVWDNRIKLYDAKSATIKSQTQQQQQDHHNNHNNSSQEEMSDKNGGNHQEQSKKLDMGMSGKRKTWKSESFEGNPVQSPRKRSELCKNLDEQSKDLSVKSPIQIKKTRSVQLRKVKSESSKSLNNDDATEKNNGKLRNSNSLQLAKSKSAKSQDLDPKCEETDDSNSLQLVISNSENFNETKFEENKVVLDWPNGIQETRSEEDEEIEVCEEKSMTGNVELAMVKVENYDNLDDQENEDEDEEKWDIDDEVKIEEKSLIVVKEMSVSEQYHNNPKKIVKEEKKKLIHRYEKSVPSSPILKKHSPPISGIARFHHIPSKPKQVPDSEESYSTSRHQSRLQSLVDLVMWKDASKSALVFGFGTFVIISSSYTHDIKFSLISVVSYMSLFYLAVIFLFRSIIHRGETTGEYVVGEEEAIWVLKLMLPYINEFLLKIRALFSGDPATTMKMAVLLFVLAQCATSITIWKMAKLGFFGVFTVPKVCSSYSPQLTAYGKFWVRRFRDAWESCTHKKAVVFGIFTLVWNLSSFVARIWAVFMLYVAFRYYQESMVREEWDGEGTSVKPEGEEEEEANIGLRKVSSISTFRDTRKKQKKPL